MLDQLLEPADLVRVLEPEVADLHQEVEEPVVVDSGPLDHTVSEVEFRAFPCLYC